jgi:uncharacterized membrane protein YdjX (TVP38/TMEM64 family)
LKERTKRNLDVLEEYLTERKHVGFIVFLTYAFSPFPSNQLFIAYGLTKLKLRYIAVPFLVGRLASYLFLTFATNKVADIFPEELSSAFGSYFIIVQLLSIGSVYLFARIDWKKLLKKKKVELI